MHSFRWREFRRWMIALSIAAFGVGLYFERAAVASGIQALATVPAGGTGLTTLTAHSPLVGEGTSNVGLPGAGTAGQCFESNGASSDPSWQTCAGGGGITVYSGTALTLTAGTRYFPIGGGGTPSTTETDVDVEAPSAATITNFYAQLSVTLGAGQTATFTWRNAAADQSVTCQITGTATSCNDTTHSFTVAQGNLIDIKLVTTGTVVATPNLVMAVQFGTTGSNGTVNAGTINQGTCYLATGTAVSGCGDGPTWTALSGLYAANTLADEAGVQAGQFQKDVTGRVWVRGTVTCNGNRTIANGATLWTFPAGYRPLASLIFFIDNSETGTGTSFLVTSAGVVTIRDNFVCTQNINYLELDGVFSFSVN